jgi:hypothetical protein
MKMVEELHQRYSTSNNKSAAIFGHESNYAK